MGDSEGQGRMACCSPWGCRVGSDLMTEQKQTYVCMYFGCAGSSLLNAGFFSIFSAQISHFSGFSCCRAQAVGQMGFSSCGEWELLLVAACGVSLQWLLLLQSTEPRHVGFRSCRFGP